MLQTFVAVSLITLSQPAISSGDGFFWVLQSCPLSNITNAPFSYFLHIIMVLYDPIKRQCARQNSFCCRIHVWFRWLGVCRQSRWRHTEPSRPRWQVCVTMATLWQQQDGGYMLFYIFNSTVIDWTCFFYLMKRLPGWTIQDQNPRSGKRFFCFPECPERLWGHPARYQRVKGFLARPTSQCILFDVENFSLA